MTTISIRPLQEEDIPNIVDYWFKNTDENLIQMGVDKTKFVSQTEFTNSLQAICNAPLDKVKSYYLIWLIDNKPIGYNALKDILKDEIANMHLHMWNAEYRGKGYGAKLFCMAALEFYSMFNLKMILCEPRSSNPMPNKMLAKIGFKKWKTYLSTSSELSLTCELNSYIIDAEIAANFLR
jgi:RimJ/RimL family protein N-acetyltransferase